MACGDNLNCDNQSVSISRRGGSDIEADTCALMSSLKLKGYMLKLGSWNGTADNHMDIFNFH